MQQLLQFSLFFVLICLIGCQKKQVDLKVSTSESATSATENWLTITADKDALSDATSRAEQIKLEEYERIFAHLGDEYGYVGFETIEKLSRNDVAVSRLKKELSANVVTATGVGAALLLCQLHDAEGRSYLVNVSICKIR